MGAEEENLKYTWCAAAGLILCISHVQGRKQELAECAGLSLERSPPWELLWSILCVKKSSTVRLRLPWPSIHECYWSSWGLCSKCFAVGKSVIWKPTHKRKIIERTFWEYLFSSNRAFSSLHGLRGSHENERSKLKLDCALASEFSEWKWMSDCLK